MAKYDFTQAHFSISTASGSTTVVDISDSVDTISAPDLEAVLQEKLAMGDTWQEQLYVNVRRMGAITVGGFYDDTAATGPHTIFGDVADVGSSRAVQIDFGSSDILDFRVFIQNYRRQPTAGEMTRYELVIQPTGTIATAT